MNLVQEGIYKKCEEDPERMFWHLVKNNFANAKLYWGEWEYHLRLMVLSDNPLDYMKKFT